MSYGSKKMGYKELRKKVQMEQGQIGTKYRITQVRTQKKHNKKMHYTLREYFVWLARA